jgi:hypothetical protein
VVDAKVRIAAVEIAHLARSQMRRADRQTRRAAIDERKIDEVEQCRPEWRGRIVAGAIGPERISCAELRQRIQGEEVR